MQHVWLRDGVVVIRTKGDSSRSQQGCAGLDNCWPTLWQFVAFFLLGIRSDLELNRDSDVVGWVWCAGWSCVDREIVIGHGMVLSWS